MNSRPKFTPAFSKSINPSLQFSATITEMGDAVLLTMRPLTSSTTLDLQQLAVYASDQDFMDASNIAISVLAEVASSKLNLTRTNMLPYFTAQFELPRSKSPSC
jgi:hypothetical protein